MSLRVESEIILIWRSDSHWVLLFDHDEGANAPKAF